jgi:hypothetical protein
MESRFYTLKLSTKSSVNRKYYLLSMSSFGIKNGFIICNSDFIVALHLQWLYKWGIQGAFRYLEGTLEGMREQKVALGRSPLQTSLTWQDLVLVFFSKLLQKSFGCWLNFWKEFFTSLQKRFYLKRSLWITLTSDFQFGGLEIYIHEGVATSSHAYRGRWFVLNFWG